MSYILEALKKAQAERQLGNAPTLHAPTLRAGTQAQQGVKKNTWLMVAALGAMAAALAVLAVLLWRPAASPASSPAASPSESPAAVLAAAPAALQPEPSMSAPEAARAPLPLPAPVAALPPPVATTTTAPAPAAPAPAVLPAAAAPAATATSVEPVLNLRELPEPIQRSIPPVVVGGYIYSKNAADRLLLVDKILRREGEEVAPGLLLEKLNPKEAVFNFKGYRYRVPY
ncbi:MAG: general secretion pathway protein GspB [Duganella sp.]